MRHRLGPQRNAQFVLEQYWWKKTTKEKRLNDMGLASRADSALFGSLRTVAASGGQVTADFGVKMAYAAVAAAARRDAFRTTQARQAMRAFSSADHEASLTQPT